MIASTEQVFRPELLLASVCVCYKLLVQRLCLHLRIGMNQAWFMVHKPLFVQSHLLRSTMISTEVCVVYVNDSWARHVGTDESVIKATTRVDLCSPGIISTHFPKLDRQFWLPTENSYSALWKKNEYLSPANT